MAENATERRRRARGLGRKGIGELAALLVCLAALWAAGLWLFADERGRLAGAASQEAENVARAVAETTDRSIVHIEGILRTVQASRVAGRLPLPLPAGFSLTLTDRDGRVVWSDTPDAALDGAPSDIAGEPAFRHFAGTTAEDLFVGAPVPGRLSRRWSLPFARRLASPSGVFDGVAVLAIDPERLLAGLRTLDFGPRGLLLLLRSDGTVIGRAGGAAAGTLLGDHLDPASAPDAARGLAQAQRGVERSAIGVRVTLDRRDGLAALDTGGRVVGLLGAVLTAVSVAAWARLHRLRGAAAAGESARATMASAADAAYAAAEAAADARAALGCVLGRELRTPLNGILGGLDLLQDTPLDAEQAEFAEAIQRAAHDLLRLAESVLPPPDAAALAVASVAFPPTELARRAPAQVEDAAARCLPESPAAAGLRVLLVDDNRVNRVVGTHMLERLGHVVEQAETGAEAVAAVRRGGCDLVVMDVMMPGMDGLAATRAIRALPGPARNCPVVGLTANVSRADRAACRDAGMDGFLAKPVTGPKLAAAVALAVSLRPAATAPAWSDAGADAVAPLASHVG